MTGVSASPRPPQPQTVLRDTPWADLRCAPGCSADGVPPLLAGLLDEDAVVQAGSLEELQMLLPAHLGCLYEGTAPAALFVAGILSDPRTLSPQPSWDERVRPLRAELLEWLGTIASTVLAHDKDEDWDEDYGKPPSPEGHAACRAARPAICTAVIECLADADPLVREAAVEAAWPLLMAPEMRERVPAASWGVRAAIAAAEDRRSRAAAVLTLADWGRDTSEYLSDVDPAVRACAAIGARAETDPSTVVLLKQHLADPSAADDWFEGVPVPQIRGAFRLSLLRALLERTNTLEEIIDTALILIPYANSGTVGEDCGPLLVRAFPDGDGATCALSEAQHRLLSAVASNDECWYNMGAALEYLQEAGLPLDRAVFQALTRAASHADCVTTS